MRRISAPTISATSNMLSTFMIERKAGSRSPFWMPCLMRAMTPWVMERLPEQSRAMTRSPVFSKVTILVKRETLSIPALVRVSARSTSPSATRRPTQYVIVPFPSSLLLLLDLLGPTRGRQRDHDISLDPDLGRTVHGAPDRGGVVSVKS